jgi:hypothetical protein
METYLKPKLEIKPCRICGCINENTIIINRSTYHQTCLNELWNILHRNMSNDVKNHMVDSIVTSNITINKLLEMLF